jgi:protein-tyrosine phosphatase
MKLYDRVVFVGRSGSCREPMAAGILQDLLLKEEIEVLARGLVVSFPEPMNQKAEAVLISNGISMPGFVSVELAQEDVAGNTLVLTMDSLQKEKVLSHFSKVTDVYTLNEFVGDELEIVDPYGGALPAYGLCYEMLRKSIKKLVKILSEGEYKWQK